MSRKAPLWKMLLLSGTVAFGIAAAWFAVVMWHFMVIQGALRRPERSEMLEAGLDGQPVIVRTFHASGSSEVTTLAGEKLRTTSQDLLHPLFIQNRRQLAAYRFSNWDRRLASINDGGAPAVYWYLLHDGNRPGRAYGVGYHSVTKTRVGYFGRGGFRETPPPRDEWFEIAGDQGLYGATIVTWTGEPSAPQTAGPVLPLLANGKLWAIDVGQRQVKAVADCPTGFALGQAWQLAAEPPPKNPDVVPLPAESTTPMKIVVRQSDSLIVVDQRGEKPATFPLPANVDDAMLAPYLLANGNLLLILARADAHGETTWETMLLGSDGRTIKEEPVRLANNVVTQSLGLVAWEWAAAAPAPLASGLIVGVGPVLMARSGQADSYPAALAKIVGASWLSVLLVLAIGGACAAAAYRRQRRFGLPHAVAWAAFVFVLGIPGWIAYRFHRRWPVLEDCPNCRQLSPRDREACLDCGAVFPPPPMKGIEVFA